MGMARDGCGGRPRRPSGKGRRYRRTDIDIPTLVYSCMPVYVSSEIDEQSLSFFFVWLFLFIPSPLFLFITVDLALSYVPLPTFSTTTYTSTTSAIFPPFFLPSFRNLPFQYSVVFDRILPPFSTNSIHHRHPSHTQPPYQ